MMKVNIKIINFKNYLEVEILILFFRTSKLFTFQQNPKQQQIIQGIKKSFSIPSSSELSWVRKTKVCVYLLHKIITLVEPPATVGNLIKQFSFKCNLYDDAASEVECSLLWIIKLCEACVIVGWGCNFVWEVICCGCSSFVMKTARRDAINQR